MAAVPVDGAGEFESEPPASPAEAMPESSAQGDSPEGDTTSEIKVPHPSHDEVITVTDLAGRTINLGFNSQNAEFIEVDGDLIVTFPNGGVVILEGLTSALLSEPSTILLFDGKPLSAGEILAVNDGDLHIAPAGEAQTEPPNLPGGGASTYDDNLGPITSEIGTGSAGADAEQSILKTGPVSAVGGEDESLGRQLDPAAVSSSSVSANSTSTTPLANDEEGNGKDGTNGEEKDLGGNDINASPTDLNLNNSDVLENNSGGEVVGVVSATDPDEGDSFTYELVDDAGGRFAIDSRTGTVTVANGAALDHEAAASHDITIRVTDSGGESYQETFTIHVNDINEAPTDLDLSGTSVPEDSAGAPSQPCQSNPRGAASVTYRRV